MLGRAVRRRVGRDARRPDTELRRWFRAVDGAALAVLVWVGFSASSLQELIGVRPYVWTAMAALVGAVLGAFSGAALLRGVAVLVAGWFLVVGATPLAGVLAPRTVRRDRPAPDSGATFDAVAVLSGAIDGRGLVVKQGLDRLIDALDLARRSGRPLVVSVVRQPWEDGSSSDADERWLATLAGVEGRLWAVGPVTNTHDEAVGMAALARRQGWSRLALITSPSHTRRACAAFERAGVAVVCTPSRSRGLPYGKPQAFQRPAERLAAMGEWLYEELAWALYRTRGWI